MLTVNGTEIKAGSEGNATITIKLGDISKQFSITVLKASTNQRTPKAVKFLQGDSSVSKVDLVSGDKKLNIKIKVLDQHGNPIKEGFNINKDIQTIGNNPIKIAEVKNLPITFDNKGEADISIISLGKDTIGTGVLRIQKQVNNTTEDISTLSVVVSKESDIKTYRMDIPSDKDYNLDKYYPKKDLSKKDDELTVTVNEVSSNGYVMGPLDIKNNRYNLEVINSNNIENNSIVTVTKGSKEGTITINTVENDLTGRVTIRLYENVDGKKTQIGKDISINVIDSTPTISDIKVNQLESITDLNTNNEPEFKLEDMFDITYVKIDPKANISDKDDESKFKKVLSGVKLNGYETDEVLLHIDNKGDTSIATIFIDESGDGKFTKGRSIPDLVLGTVKIELSNIIGNINNYTKIKLNKNQKGKIGHIITRFYNGEYSLDKTPFKNVNIEVNIPND